MIIFKAKRKSFVRHIEAIIKTMKPLKTCMNALVKTKDQLKRQLEMIINTV